MSTKIYIPALLMVLSLPASAEIFKCQLASGKVIYQTTPCPPTTKDQHVVEVKKPDPKTEADAEAKFKDWQKELTIQEAAEAEAEKQRKVERDRLESIELQRRSAIAQEQQAIAAQQHQEQANRVIVAPLYNGFPLGNGYRPHDDNHHKPSDNRSNPPWDLTTPQHDIAKFPYSPGSPVNTPSQNTNKP